MRTSNFGLKAAWLLLLGTAAAVPAPVEATAVSSLSSTINGTPTALAAKETTTLSTEQLDSSQTTNATAPPAHANSDVEACHNTEGEFKPFCAPKNNDVFYPWTTHWVTWDPTFFPGTNTTLKVVGFYTNNETVFPITGPPTGSEDEAFTSEEIEAGWGSFRWRPEGSLLKDQRVSITNITLRIVALPKNGQHARWLTGPTVTLQYKPKPPPKPKKQQHHDFDELYIALPLVFGFATLMIVGTFFWNRQLRQIGVGSVMGRSKSRRSKGLGVSRRDRAMNRNAEQSIRLMENGGGGAGSDGEDWDGGWRESEAAGKRVFDRVDRKRR